MKIPNFDDRDLAIVGLCVIAICALFILSERAVEVVTAGVAAIAGLAQGRKTA